MRWGWWCSQLGWLPKQLVDQEVASRGGSNNNKSTTIWLFAGYTAIVYSFRAKLLSISQWEWKEDRNDFLSNGWPMHFFTYRALDFFPRITHADGLLIDLQSNGELKELRGAFGNPLLCPHYKCGAMQDNCTHAWMITCNYCKYYFSCVQSTAVIIFRHCDAAQHYQIEREASNRVNGSISVVLLRIIHNTHAHFVSQLSFPPLFRSTCHQAIVYF